MYLIGSLRAAVEDRLVEIDAGDDAGPVRFHDEVASRLRTDRRARAGAGFRPRSSAPQAPISPSSGIQFFESNENLEVVTGRRCEHTGDEIEVERGIFMPANC